MIVSASRRTDLPAAHAEWLFERFRQGFVLVRNPMNPRQVRRVALSPEKVDGIVFWTKNPLPVLHRLDALREYAYYFQFTLTGYGRDVEANLPCVEDRVDAFRRLAERLGPERVLWRYDPILLSRTYSVAWHLENFSRLAKALRGCTDLVTVSFVDTYARNKRRLEETGALPVSEKQMRAMAVEIAGVAAQNGMRTAACSEAVDLRDCGVEPARCVDAARLSRIGGVQLREKRDPNQRDHCGCAPSVDIGAYNTCPNGCAYCYANYSPALLRANLEQSAAGSPLLCGALTEGDRVTEAGTESLREGQLRMKLE